MKTMDKLLLGCPFRAFLDQCFQFIVPTNCTLLVTCVVNTVHLVVTVN
jgi:hypothetical protein